MDPEAQQLKGLLSSRAWRLDNLYQVVDEDSRVVPFVARGEQLEFRRDAENLNFVPKARKLGMSTEIVLENGDACIFSPNFKAAIIDKGEEDAWEKLQIFRFAWENGPKHRDARIAAIWREIHAANPLTSDSNGELGWDNGSCFQAGVSFVGATPQSLHISEYGPICAQKAARGLEIRRGSMNAVPMHGRVTIETTMEGGRIGPCYDIFRLALKSSKKIKEERTPLDWRLHFFSWLGHPSYILPGFSPHKAETHQYFQELTAKYGDELFRRYGYREVPLARQAWWEGKKETAKDEMPQQFPTVIDECDMAVTVGAIYPEMTTVRAQGRVNNRVFAEKGYPLYTFWDLGTEDAVAGWCIQEVGREINVIDWSAGEGVGAESVADVIRRWSAQHGEVHMNFLPHDAEIREKGTGLSYRQQLTKYGITNVIIVPRTPQIFIGIDEVRRRLPRMWFHSRCDEVVKNRMGDELPGGVGRLESYRKKPNPAGGVQGLPVKDGICDHTADALRTYGEASAQNLIVGATIYQPQPQAGRVRAVMSGSAW